MFELLRKLLTFEKLVLYGVLAYYVYSMEGCLKERKKERKKEREINRSYTV